MLVAGAAHAQDFPARPIKIIVGFAPGGGTDIAARIIAKKLSDNLGQQVLVENRPGGGGVLATDLVVAAPPDGYTINLGAVGPLAVNPHMQKVRYDVERDLAPITMAVMFPNVLVVHASVKATNVQEYVALARAPGSSLAYGTSGVGGAGHLAGELFNRVAKTSIPHVAYKGGGPAMNDLLGGQVPSLFASLPSALPHVKTGRIRALAQTGRTRSPDLPDVPTVAEAGFPDYEATNWYAFVAPAKVPRPILDRLNTELVKVLRSKDVVDQLGTNGMEANPGSADALARYIRRESATWAEVVKAAGIRAD
jgi:tripartite-type tricarboxylate transporter receptor subunit TctC